MTLEIWTGDKKVSTWSNYCWNAGGCQRLTVHLSFQYTSSKCGLEEIALVIFWSCTEIENTQLFGVIWYSSDEDLDLSNLFNYVETTCLQLQQTRTSFKWNQIPNRLFFLIFIFKLFFSVGRHACYSVHIVRGQVLEVNSVRWDPGIKLGVGYLKLLSHLTAPWVWYLW